MSSKMSAAILKTLIYADIFDYPLTREEIWQRLIWTDVPTKINLSWRREFNNFIDQVKFIQCKDGYYFLPGREKIVEKRLARKACSGKKIIIAAKIAKFLKIIPSIQFIGISGGLAVENADDTDDIDLFIISKSNLIWTTRLLAILVIGLIGLRRVPHDQNIANKICLNMFMDEDCLSLSKEDHNLYIAHEIIQLKPLYDRNNLYPQLAGCNIWIRNFLPNAVKSIKYKTASIEYRNKSWSSYVEALFRNWQLWYMRKRRTTEVIKEGIIRFHPHDVKNRVLRKFNLRWKSTSKLLLTS